jgi:hypothetical protein
MRDSRKEILIEQCDFIVKEDIEWLKRLNIY